MPNVIQPSFNSGEWAPSLYARVDLQKFRSGAALLENFFVDYRGGASTRVGSKYILRGYIDDEPIRMIPFQSSFALGFAMEFGDMYVRFYQSGAPILETGLNITAATKANPCVVTVANTYQTGDVDWVYISGVGGMTQLNGKFFIIHVASPTQITLYDLFGNPVNSTGYGTYTAGGTAQRVYTLTSPYAAADLALLKFAQNGNTLTITHPDYVTYVLTAITATSWTLVPAVFGTTAGTPTGVVASTTLSAGGVYYSYVVTSIDSSGQESVVSTPGTISAVQDLRTVAGTNYVVWNLVAGAVSYNVYKAEVAYNAPVPTGVAFGFIGNTTGNSFNDSNVTQDYSQPPPIAQNPFDTGAGVLSVTLSNAGSYTPPAATPTVSFSAPGGGGITATGVPVFHAISIAVAAAGTGYAPGDSVAIGNGVVINVATIGGGGSIATIGISQAGSISTSLPANPQAQVTTTGAGTGGTFTITWGILSVTITQHGTKYLAGPAVTFSSGAAAATTVLGSTGDGNPSVPAYFQQRLVLAATAANPQTLYMSQPGQYYNFNISNPIQDDDSITATLVNGQLNNIKAMISQSGGLIVLTDGASFLVNGGSLGSAVTPSSVTSNAQSFVGANDMPPIVSNFDILYVKSKGSGVQDSTYNFYTNVFTGKDISVIASHLFYGYQMLEWCWAEEPLKIIYIVRNDGVMLTLTFIKEEEFIAWAHADTDGSYKSVCTIVEPATIGNNNFVYNVVERDIGAGTVQYIEVFPERLFPNGVEDAWTVDCGLQYSGAPATTFSGGEHLVGKTCTGLADGLVITPFVMAASGNFTLPVAASKVTIGLAYQCNLQTLYLDTGDPTIQSKMKKIPSETLRVSETLGLKIGTDEDNLVKMKDLIVGNVGSMTNERVTDLVTGDVKTFLDPKWQEAGTIYIRQDLPFPATILGVIPELTVGDTE